MKYHIWLDTRAPLLIAQTHSVGNQLESLGHIPGPTWRGALAAAIIRQHYFGPDSANHPSFRTLFLEDRVRFGDLYPLSLPPLPASARVCSASDDHPVQDLLVLRSLGHPLPRHCGTPLANGPCKAKLQPLTEPAEILPRGFRRTQPIRRLAAHSAIDATTLRVRDEQFFTQLSVDRNSSFEGALWAADSLAAQLAEDTLRAIPHLILGRGGTRGQGLVELQIGQEASAESDTLSTLTAWNDAWPDSDTLSFAATLRSPCLVFDEWGRVRPFLTPADISEAAGEPANALETFTLVDWFSSLTTIGGWNAQAGLPKSDILAITPGSAFLFTAPIRPEHRPAELQRLARLLTAAAAGIGERWAEGFGEVCFCHPVHLCQRRVSQ